MTHLQSVNKSRATARPDLCKVESDFLTESHAAKLNQIDFCEFVTILVLEGADNYEWKAAWYIHLHTKQLGEIN